MDAFNLKTASAYLNNLLLARGLLRNGKPIEFAHPSKGEGGKEATMAQIINLVHDMILRRDREQEQRESLSSTLRTMGTEATRNAVTMERLQTRNDDLTRQLSLANSQERSARAALRTAESSARALREEMVRMRAVVHQIRTACANDVRKRDVQIQRLKKHLTSQQRGNKTLVGASITITPGASGAIGGLNAAKEEDSPDVEDPEYSLKQETTEFLTQLSQSLSDENDSLISLVRTTLTTLHEIQGIPDVAERVGLPDIMEGDNTNEHMLQALPTSYDALATDMHIVLENLRTLLTNPNFVPIEEVSVREDEILRLREGWEKMEGKWREAMLMMDGWRKRMIHGGDTINIEDLKKGLGLGQGLGTAANLHNISSDLDNEDQSLDDFDDSVSVHSDDALDLPEPDDESLEDEQIGSSRNHDVVSKSVPLQEGANAKSPRKVAFASKSNSPAIQAVGGSKEKENNNNRSLSKNLPTPSLKRPHSSLGKHKSSDLPKENESRIPRKTLKRLSNSHSSREEFDESNTSVQPKLTTQEKLNIAQAEAEAAAVAAGIDLGDLNEVRFEGFGEEMGKEDTVKGRLNSRREGSRREETSAREGGRKTRVGGRARRRKSTLTPAELEMLMFE